MTQAYELEKLGNAVDALAVSAASIQSRLECAWTAMYTLIDHRFTDPERSAEFADINKKLAADSSNDRVGYAQITCLNLSDDEAVEIAQAIVDLNARLIYDRIWLLEDEINAV